MQITKRIDRIIEQSFELPIVLDIVEETRLWINEHLIEGKDEEEEEEVLRGKKEEVFERPKFAAFTPVTAESFALWKKEFDAKHKVTKVERRDRDG